MATEEIVRALPRDRPNPFDPAADLGRLRQERGLSRLAFPDGHVGWLVTRYDLARAVLSDRRFSSRQELQHLPVPQERGRREQGPEPGLFPHLDRPEHSRYRRVLAGRFTGRRIKPLEPAIEAIAGNCLDAMARAGPPADLVTAFARPVPRQVICELLGIPGADRPMLEPELAALIDLASTHERLAAALGTITGYLRDLLARQRAGPAEPAGDLLGELVTGTDLSVEELTNVTLVLLTAGALPTSNMLALGPFALLSHPRQRALLRSDPAVLDTAVDELLRYLSINRFDLRRAALEDVEMAGEVIQAGETVVVALAAANRDPSRFCDPDTLDLRRRDSGDLAFGHGIHHCLGQQLARAELRIGLAQLLRRFPRLALAVPAQDVPMLDNSVLYGVRELPVAW
jgi:cytochrome P450